MAEKRRGKKKKDDCPMDIKGAPTKEMQRVADYLIKHVPCKKTKFLYHTVKYFIASKAVDALMDSPFAKSSGKNEPLFTTRESIERFMDNMLRQKFFHRAKKITVTHKDLKTRSALKKAKDGGDKKKQKKDLETSQDEKKDDEKEEGTKEKEKEKEKKRKVKLDMHLEQMFVDGSDAYVWIYDPVPLHYWFIGGLVVIGIIAVCLFPLWPPIVRQGVYYLSLAAAGFLAFIIGLAILRLIIFCIIWVCTIGRHHLWILPNLTEDVGFFASFWPLYHYEYKGPNEEDTKEKKKKKKAKLSDDESSKPDDGKSKKGSRSKDSGDDDAQQEKDGDKSTANESDSEEESESSQNTQTGKDFEMVDKEDVTS